MENSNNSQSCSFKNGSLPSCAPLAVGFIPFQQTGAPRYDSKDALSRGTLFPGLDLPFMNKANGELADNSQLAELMAMSFVIDELGLYLDTHKEDKEAFEVYKKCVAMYKNGYEKYVAENGPITQTDTINFDSYRWLESPWPWENTDRVGK